MNTGAGGGEEETKEPAVSSVHFEENDGNAVATSTPESDRLQQVIDEKITYSHNQPASSHDYIFSDRRRGIDGLGVNHHQHLESDPDKLVEASVHWSDFHAEATRPNASKIKSEATSPLLHRTTSLKGVMDIGSGVRFELKRMASGQFNRPYTNHDLVLDGVSPEGAATRLRRASKASIRARNKKATFKRTIGGVPMEVSTRTWAPQRKENIDTFEPPKQKPPGDVMLSSNMKKGALQKSYKRMTSAIPTHGVGQPSQHASARRFSNDGSAGTYAGTDSAQDLEQINDKLSTPERVWVRVLEWAEWWMKSRQVQNTICAVTLLSCLAYVIETYMIGDCIRSHGIWDTLAFRCKVQPASHAFLYWFEIFSLMVFAVDFVASCLNAPAARDYVLTDRKSVV